ncbi:transcription factor Jun-like [Uloborus diversus]|uniref:transcription factor Jun-like n=1 Tax=Uloborus diversus TaxID=327109 RepID=UPI0024096E76|nr:transcription factor Jun-like [Uloborus diversus]
MEMTLYDDSQFRSGKNSGRTMKRPVTLDLDSPETASKKQKFPILTSPDLNMLKLASPELERFIIANSGNITTTPTPTQYLFPKDVTEAQEQYARGFIDALNQLHQKPFDMNSAALKGYSESNSIGTPGSATIQKLYPNFLPIYLQHSPTSVIKTSDTPKKSVITTNASSIVRPPSVESSNSNSCNSNSYSVPLQIAIKEELQTVPSDFSTPPMSPIQNAPIDMADQERIKLERKRQRNRVAASKCRKRKLEKISQLEDKVKELKGENSKLELIADKLREQVSCLKQEVMEHVRKGCQMMIAHLV